MKRIIQITDIHIVDRDGLLYGEVDTADHLQRVIEQINRISPKPDLVLVTGDLLEVPSLENYTYFLDLISEITAPTYVIPGNHDNPEMMAEAFEGTAIFPTRDGTFQYRIELDDLQILMLNSVGLGHEVANYPQERIDWLEQTLENAPKIPTLLAIHHPPFHSGVDIIDISGDSWYADIARIITNNAHIKLVISGHAHLNILGEIANTPVYVAEATSYQLHAARDIDIAPAFIKKPAPPILHTWTSKGTFISGSYPWEHDVDEVRIDIKSGLEWPELKRKLQEK